jgi:hypothetical protein
LKYDWVDIYIFIVRVFNNPIAQTWLGRKITYISVVNNDTILAYFTFSYNRLCFMGDRNMSNPDYDPEKFEMDEYGNLFLKDEKESNLIPKEEDESEDNNL